MSWNRSFFDQLNLNINYLFRSCVTEIIIKICMTFNSTPWPNYLLEKVAASSLRSLNSFRSFIIVSLTIAFSFSYLDLRFVRATSAVFLLDLSTVRNVAICSRFVERSDFSFITCSCSSASSASFESLLIAAILKGETCWCYIIVIYLATISVLNHTLASVKQPQYRSSSIFKVIGGMDVYIQTGG